MVFFQRCIVDPALMPRSKTIASETVARLWSAARLPREPSSGWRVSGAAVIWNRGISNPYRSPLVSIVLRPDERWHLSCQLQRGCLHNRDLGNYPVHLIIDPLLHHDRYSSPRALLVLAATLDDHRVCRHGKIFETTFGLPCETTFPCDLTGSIPVGGRIVR